MRLYSSASAEETTESSYIFDTVKSNLTTTKPSKPIWPFFSQKNANNQLCEIFSGFDKHGVPQSRTFLSFEHPDSASAIAYMNNMHSSWKEFVNESNMQEHEIIFQSAIWELVSTEVDYIHALQTVSEVLHFSNI